MKGSMLVRVNMENFLVPKLQNVVSHAH